jgi:tripartite ATP-independent transporter DctP family solute receptor
VTSWSSSVKIAGIVAASALTLTACGGGEQSGGAKEVTLKLAHVFPESSAVHTAATSLQEKAPEVTGGRVNFELFPGSQLGGDEELGTGLANGDVECAFFASTASGLDPRLQLSLLPYVATSYEAVDKVFYNPDGVIQKNETAVLGERGITSVAYYENDFRGITNNVKPVQTPEDLKGLKLRVPGLPMYVKLFSAWGAQPVSIPFPELYTALQQGTVDGQDNGIVLSSNSRFDEVQNQITLTRHGYGMGTLACNTGVWEGLSEEDRTALRTLASEIAETTTKEVRDSVAAKLEDLKKSGMNVVELSEERVNAFAQVKDEIWNENKSVFGDETIEELRKESEAAANG